MSISQAAAAEALGFFVTLILLAVNSSVDVIKKNIYPVMTIVTAALGIVTRIFFIQCDMEIVLTGLVPGIFLLMLSLFTRGKIGAGDGLIIIAIGAWFIWDEVLFIMAAAFVIAGIAGCAYLAVYRKNGEIPFVPFIFAAFALNTVIR